VARGIEESHQRAEALRALASSLAKAEQWEQAEGVARSIEESDPRALALRALASSLAEAEQWEQAEGVARGIEESHQRAEALRALADTLLAAHEYKRLVSLLHASWLQVETRNDALRLFSLALVLLSIQPEIGMAFYHGFQWVDTFLSGE